MPARLVKSNTKFRTYSIKGETLEDLWASIRSRGPRDPNDNKNVAFLTTTTLSCDPDALDAEGDGRITVERRSGWFEARAKVKRMEMRFTSEIRCPKRSVGGLSWAATAEWYRFYACALVHEGEHVKKALEESKRIVSEINGLRGEGLGQTEAEAAQGARDDLVTRIFDDYQGKMDARLNKLHAKFDKTTKHGASKGAKLDLSVV